MYKIFIVDRDNCFTVYIKYQFYDYYHFIVVSLQSFVTHYWNVFSLLMLLPYQSCDIVLGLCKKNIFA